MTADTRSWRQQVKTALLHFGYYYSIASGVLALHYNSRTRQVRRSLALNIYSTCLNVLLVLAAPYAYAQTLRTFQFHGSNKLMEFIGAYNTFLRFAVFVIVILLRCRRDKRVQHIVQQLLQIEEQYLRQFHSTQHIQQYYDNLLFLKACVVCCNVVAVFFMLSKFSNGFSLAAIQVYLMNMANVLMALQCHYFALLWHISKRFALLNAQLEQIHSVLEKLDNWHLYNGRPRAHASRAVLQQALAEEVQAIGQLHARLTRLVQLLNKCYGLEIVFVITEKILFNVSSAYMCVMVFVGRTDMSLSIFEMLLSVLGYAMNMADGFLIEIMADETVTAAHDTGEILKRFTELGNLEATLERNCDLLSQQLRQQKLRMRYFGILSLSKRNSLIVLGEIIQHAVFLVQYDIAQR